MKKYFAVSTGGGGGGGVDPGDIDKEAKDLVETVSILKDAFNSLGAIIKEQINQNMQNSVGAARNLARTTSNDLVKAFRDLGKGSQQLLDNEERLREGQLSTKDLHKQLLKLEERRKSAGVDLLNATKEGIISATDARNLYLEIERSVKETRDELEKQLLVSQKQEEVLKSIKGTYGKIFEGLEKVPFFGKLIDAEKVIKRMKEAALAGGSKWKVLGAGIDQTFLNMGKNLPLAALAGAFSLFKQLFEMALNFNKKVFELAKNLGIGVEKARELNSQFMKIAQNSGNLGIAAKEVGEAYGEMTQQLGFMVPATQDFAGTMTLVKKMTGASAEEMATLANFSALSGKSVSSTYQTMMGVAKVSGAQNKLSLTNKQIMSEISKVSHAVLINFKNNLPALTEAVIRAKKLGTNLETVNKQAETLLDFESSIQNQFEAEALTGQELNLERARSLALMGDTKGVMEELNNQGMTMTKYQEMNVIQREAFAKSIGLSNEELAKQLNMQAQANALGAQQGQSLQDRYNQLLKEGKTREEIVGLIGQSEEAQLRQASLSDQWNKTLERLQDILGKILEGPVKDIVDEFVKFVNNTKAVEELGNKIKGVFETVVSVVKHLPQILAAAVEVSKVLVAVSIARAVASVAASAGATPIVGLGLAVAAAATMYGVLTSMMGGLGLGMFGGGSASAASQGSDVMGGIKPVSKADEAKAAKENKPSIELVDKRETYVKVEEKTVGQASMNAQAKVPIGLERSGLIMTNPTTG